MTRPAATIGGDTFCCSTQLSYRTREGVTRIRTGNLQINVVPPAFAAGSPHWRQSVTRVFRTAPPGKRDSNPQDHVLPPAFASSFQKKGPTSVLVETQHWKDVVPPAFGPLRPLDAHNATNGLCASRFNSFDPSDPVIRFKLPRSKHRNHFEYLIGESPDVQDVRALRGLRRLIRLDVQANQASLRIPLPEFRPLSQQRSSPAASLIHPRFVIRNEDHEIANRLATV